MSPMCRDRFRVNRAFPSRAQRGFSLVTAIFLLVVLAALGAIAVSISGLQQSTVALDAHGVHAYQAAYAGVQWAAYRQLKTTAPPTPNTCFATSNLTGLAQSVAPFTVTVSCTAASSDEGKATRRIATYSITATACNQPDAGTGQCPNSAPAGNYVERRLTATLHKCLDQDVGPPYSCG